MMKDLFPSTYNDSLIINADDFGMSYSVNNAIDYCLKNGIINSASVMVNTEAFEDARSKIQYANYTDKLGIHVNITQFKPVSTFALEEYLIPDGHWDRQKISKFRLKSDPAFTKSIKQEIECQIDLFHTLNIRATHINSHHHSHTYPWILPIFIEIAKKHRYPLRIAQTSPVSNVLNNIYRSFINKVLKTKGLAFSEFFEDKYTFEERKAKIQHRKTEIMVHPDFNDQNMLIDALDGLPLTSKLPKINHFQKN